MKEFECRLETNGYRLQVTVRTMLASQVETSARKMAVERLKQTHGVERREDQFVVTSFKEKGQLS